MYIICRCKYLYLLYDDSFLIDRNYIFTTEGHPLPVLAAWHDRLPDVYASANYTFIQVSGVIDKISFSKLVENTVKNLTYNPSNLNELSQWFDDRLSV